MERIEGKVHEERKLDSAPKVKEDNKIIIFIQLLKLSIGEYRVLSSSGVKGCLT